jgi:hypothetical protein
LGRMGGNSDGGMAGMGIFSMSDKRL